LRLRQFEHYRKSPFECQVRSLKARFPAADYYIADKVIFHGTQKQPAEA
jgi:hypothetical protein